MSCFNWLGMSLLSGCSLEATDKAGHVLFDHAKTCGTRPDVQAVTLNNIEFYMSQICTAKRYKPVTPPTPEPEPEPTPPPTPSKIYLNVDKSVVYFDYDEDIENFKVLSNTDWEIINK